MKISIATEDILTEEILIKIISSLDNISIPHKLGKQGSGFLLNSLQKLNELSRAHHVIAIFDLDLKPDAEEFKSLLENKITNKTQTFNIIISVREIESWILADREGFSEYLSISKEKICRAPDELLDPKEKIISLARLSKISDIKKGIPPKKGAAAKVGLSYNSLLSNFIRDKWDSERASKYSPSLLKALHHINNIENS